MATAAKVTDYPHIVKTPGVRAGKAQIDGTRICVVDIAVAYQGGHKPEDIQTHFSSHPYRLIPTWRGEPALPNASKGTDRLS